MIRQRGNYCKRRSVLRRAALGAVLAACGGRASVCCRLATDRTAQARCRGELPAIAARGGHELRRGSSWLIVDDALLLIGVVAGDQRQGRLIGAQVNRLMRHVGGDEDEVALLAD